MTRRKSSAEKKITGTFRADRDRKSLQFATADGIVIKAPAYVRQNKVAYAEWKAVAPYLIAEGILKPTDVSLLANYCVLFARWREAAKDVEERGQVITVTSTTRTGMSQRPAINPSVRSEILYSSALVKVGTKLGLNPLDRSRVEVPEPDEGPDPFEDFLNQVDDHYPKQQ